MDRLFVYGTLRSGLHHPAHTLITRYFTPLGEATVNGWLYDLGDYPGAVPAAGDELITGELYRLTWANQFAEAFAALDSYEGTLEQPPLFRREQVSVNINRENSVAWIYWYNHDVAAAVRIASGDSLTYNHKKWLYKNDDAGK